MSHAVQVEVYGNPAKKRGPGRPKGSKNKKKTTTKKNAMVAGTTAANKAKRKPGPKGSTNKKRTTKKNTMVAGTTAANPKKRKPGRPKGSKDKKPRARKNQVVAGATAANPAKKRKPGRPKGSTNKKRTTKKNTMVAGTAANPGKRKPGRPKGSKNKKKSGYRSRRNPIDTARPRDFVAALFVGIVGWFIARGVADLSTTLMMKATKKRAKKPSENAYRLVRILTRAVLLVAMYWWLQHTRSTDTPKVRDAKEALFYGAGFNAVLGTVEDAVYMLCGDSTSDSCMMMKIAARSDTNISPRDMQQIRSGVYQNPVNFDRVMGNPVNTDRLNSDPNAYVGRMNPVFNTDRVNEDPRAYVGRQNPVTELPDPQRYPAIDPKGSWNAPRSADAQMMARDAGTALQQRSAKVGVPRDASPTAAVMGGNRRRLGGGDVGTLGNRRRLGGVAMNPVSTDDPRMSVDFGGSDMDGMIGHDNLDGSPNKMDLPS